MCICNSADTFTTKDAFVGYQYDTPASVVFKVWQDLRLDDAEPSDQWEEKVVVSTCIANYCVCVGYCLNVKLKLKMSSG